MSYISLYRKYRPSCFKDVVGQDVIIKTLINSIKYDKISHAYIFNGPRGTGKTSVAKIFAKAVNCSNFENDLCNKCSCCNAKFDELIDIIELDAASNNGVDDVREIINNVKLTPSVLKYKIYIIDEVHMLSISAFNALLKTLEEPPKHAIFILATTEINKIPATILSRCQKFNFKKISENQIVNRIKYILNEENKTIDDSVIKLIAKLSNGGLRDAINLTEQVLNQNKEDFTEDDVYNLIGSISNDEIFELLDYILKSNVSKILGKIDSLLENNKDLNIIGERLETIIKDLIIYSSTNDYFDENYSSKLQNYARIDIDILLELSKIIIELNLNLKKEINQKNVFEIYMLKSAMLFNNKQKESDSKIIEDKKIETTKEMNSEEELVSDDEKKILINNALALANKDLKDKFVKEFILDEYLISKKYNNLATLLDKSKIEVVSDKNIIFSYKDKYDVLLFDKNVSEIIYLLKKIYKKSYDVVAIIDKDWNNIKKEYIENIKKGIKYDYIDVKKTVTKKKRNSELEKNVENIFGEDIIKDI